MTDTANTPLALALGAVSSLLLAQSVSAQTCDHPLYAFVPATVSGSTCGANTLPELNLGSIFTPGDDLVFKVSGTYGVTGLQLNGPPHELFVIVCSGCGIGAECVDSAETNDNGVAYAAYPQDGGDYDVIIDSPTPGCQDYSMTVIGGLGSKP